MVDNSEQQAKRAQLYSEQRTPALSEIFNKESAACAEIAALAQAYLQRVGISSSYFSGDVLWNIEWEFSEEHSFIIVRAGEKAYIYDPSNPLNSKEGKYPSLHRTEVNFDKEVRKGKKQFITAKNILNGNKAWYGVNDRSNISPEKDIT